MSFKFSKQNDKMIPLDYTAGQFAFFDIGGVYDDPKGPIRHFTISSSPTENFIMFSTRIRFTIQKEAFNFRGRACHISFW
jgi:ferredoxin-NADP reductase